MHIQTHTYLYICIYNTGWKWSRCCLPMWCLEPSGLSSHSHLPPPCPLRHLQRAQFENHSLSPSFSFYMWRGWDSERERENMTYLRSHNGWANIRAPQYSDEETEALECWHVPKSSQVVSGETTIKLWFACFFPWVHFIKPLAPLPQLPSMEIAPGISLCPASQFIIPHIDEEPALTLPAFAFC